MSRTDRCNECGRNLNGRNDICRDCLDAWAEATIWRHNEWDEGIED